MDDAVVLDMTGAVVDADLSVDSGALDADLAVVVGGMPDLMSERASCACKRGMRKKALGGAVAVTLGFLVGRRYYKGRGRNPRLF